MPKLKWPNKDTKIFISVSSNPGNTGAKLHNTCYEILDLNCIYLPLKINNLNSVKQILLSLNFSGCSVSMPFKEKLINFVDSLDVSAKKIGSINTILKKKNKLIGYNTDYYASKHILKKANKSKKNSIFVVGSGGVAKAVIQSLLDLGYKNINITSRNKKKFNKIKKNKYINFINWVDRNNFKSDILINCTPLGMFGKYSNSVPLKLPLKFKPKLIYDLTVNPASNKLNKYSKIMKIHYVPGLISSFYQGIKQFEIYNNKKINIKLLKKKLGYNFKL